MANDIDLAVMAACDFYETEFGCNEDCPVFAEGNCVLEKEDPDAFCRMLLRSRLAGSLLNEPPGLDSLGAVGDTIVACREFY